MSNFRKTTKIRNVRVLIVDDSALIRKHLRETLNKVPGIEVVATASNGFFALEKIRELSPDVVTLDFHMPRLNGLETLKRIMQENPLPVIMLSSVSTRGARLTMEALRLGAVDFMPKPAGSLVDNLRLIRNELVTKIFSASMSNLQLARQWQQRAFLEGDRVQNAETCLTKTIEASPKSPSEIFFAIGCSTGGPQALEQIIRNLPENFPAPIGVVQHMPEPFLSVYAEHLDNTTKLSVNVARENTVFKTGKVVLAPGNAHMRLVRFGDNKLVSLEKLEKEGLGYFPSVDLFFCSVAKTMKKNAVGIILSGMGKDGTAGSRAIKMLGGTIIIQDKRSAIVYGMPGSVKIEGLADYCESPRKIAEIMKKLVYRDAIELSRAATSIKQVGGFGF